LQALRAGGAGIKPDRTENYSTACGLWWDGRKFGSRKGAKAQRCHFEPKAQFTVAGLASDRNVDVKSGFAEGTTSLRLRAFA
jgi:hypothetical protein